MSPDPNSAQTLYLGFDDNYKTKMQKNIVGNETSYF